MTEPKFNATIRLDFSAALWRRSKKRKKNRENVEMNYRLSKLSPDSMLVLPQEILTKMEQAGETELKILLYVSSLLLKGAMEEEEVIAALSARFAREEIAPALSFWRGAGILRTDSRKKSENSASFGKKVTESAEKPAEPTEKTLPSPSSKTVVDAEEAPFYSAADLAAASETNPDFKNLVSFAEGRLEKVFNQSELARLYSFLDYLKMPADVIMLVIEDCCSRGKDSLRYIYKTLCDFADNGIDSYEKADALLLKRREALGFEAKIRKMFGLGERKLVPKEKEALQNWKEKWDFSEEMLEFAYEKTVSTAKKPSISYMNKILEKWHEEGFSAPEEVKNSAASQNPDKAEKSYDLEDFFQAAVSKNRKVNP